MVTKQQVIDIQTLLKDLASKNSYYKYKECLKTVTSLLESIGDADNDKNVYLNIRIDKHAIFSSKLCLVCGDGRLINVEGGVICDKCGSSLI